MTKFRQVRLQALHYWEHFTRRKCRLDGDIIADAYECDWQCDPRIPYLRNKTRTQAHISIFCSLGEWAGCLTQQLMDERFDGQYLENSDDSTGLYLHYNQILLVISELLVDFTDIYRDAALGRRLSVTKARKRLCKMGDTLIQGSEIKLTGYDVDNLQTFINHIIKHKAGENGNLHCYHHLKIKFEDKPKSRRNKTSIHVDNWNPQNATSIHMPSLTTLIITLIICYERINSLFSDNEVFSKIVEKYREDR